MFLRFSKGAYFRTNKSKNRKAVFLGDSAVMEYGNDIVGIAKLHEETEKYLDYDIVVAAKCELGADAIARFIKDMIGKSNKFTDNPSTKKRKYYVDKQDCEILPIKAEIKFSRVNKVSTTPTKEDIKKRVQEICKEQDRTFYYEVWYDYDECFENEFLPKIKGMNLEDSAQCVYKLMCELDDWYYSPDYINKLNECLKET